MASIETDNKVQYGLKNLYYSKATVTTTNDVESISYATPIKLGGARSLKTDAKLDSNDYYADDELQNTYSSFDGYDVEVGLSELCQDFKIDILGDTLDTNKNLMENPLPSNTPFALMFEFNGDAKARRHVLYYCIAGRPSSEGDTTEGKVEPKDITLKCTAKKAPSIARVKLSSTPDTTAASYDGWYTTVQIPATV